MKLLCKQATFAALAALTTVCTAAAQTAGPAEPVEYVNPFIGTQGGGNALPGPQLPHGMVKLGPDTVPPAGRANPGGYDYNDSLIVGFSHRHVDGTGGGGYQNVLVMPTTGSLQVAELEYASPFRHTSEVARPGYYAVTLDRYGVRVELTATQHAGLHRYTFAHADTAHLLIDASHGMYFRRRPGGYLYKPEVASHYPAYIRFLNDHSLEGAVVHHDNCGRNKYNPTVLYFYVEVSQPSISHGTWCGTAVSPGSDQVFDKDVGAYFDVPVKPRSVVLLKVGLSYISSQQARENVQREIPHWDFDRAANIASSRWNALLSVRVSGGTRDDLVTFYTALYRALGQPTNFTEGDRYYSGFDGLVHPRGGHDFYSDDWCIWDTFRTTHPLQALVEPEIQNDILQSYVRIYEQGGWLPSCPKVFNYAPCMPGNHVIAVIADLYAKGFRDFDVQTAYEAARKLATSQKEPAYGEVYTRLGTPPEYRELGFAPFGAYWAKHERDASVSVTLDFSYNDWCLARLAKALGHESDARFFREQAGNYRHLFDSATGFFRPKRRDGTWVEPFDPLSRTAFTESNAWQGLWFVPHDVAGLVELLGGRNAFVAKLDTFFARGLYNPGNEPDFHAPFLYDFAGAPWKTQQVVSELRERFFANAPNGLPGNDDAGATSAWFVFAALGLYPVCPGEPVYELTTPLFPEIELHLQNGRTFRIVARNLSTTNRFIQGARLNGRPWPNPWIRHSDLVQGGELLLEMGAQPSASWGASPQNAPPSMSFSTAPTHR
ncbi:MAG: glycoside hydrolase family 92 protein [Calditrichaeota bacterium]|nr:glycoside hydrolase family 92 protein [Calditrichota bacterium]